MSERKRYCRHGVLDRRLCEICGPRDAIIEECARVADEYCEALKAGKQVLPFGIAAAIRRLKDKP